MAFDVIGIGCASVDELLYVDANPGADGKAPVRRAVRAFGGLVGTALVAAARLGARCAYAGRLGTDGASLAVADNFRRAGVDVSLAPIAPEHRVVRSTIVVAARPPGRAIFYAGEGAIGAHESLPRDGDLAGARALLVDMYGVAGSIRAARIVRAAGGGVVGDLEAIRDARFAELLAAVDHLVLSREAAGAISGRGDIEQMIAALWSPDRALVAVTDGAAGCWWRDRDAGVRHEPAFAVRAVDTTGCGDVFHGAYAHALARGLPAAERIRLASAAAALKATRAGGQDGCPSAADVDAFLAAPHPR